MKAAAIETAPVDSTALPGRENRLLADYAELVKMQLTLLVLLSTGAGFYLGWRGKMSLLPLAHALFGSALAAAGAAALNQWWERQHDAIMERTRYRPIPAGRMQPQAALLAGLALAAGGVVYLTVESGWLAAVLAAATVLIYVLCYTPLKRISVANTLVGAVPGALPPLIGWAAARSELGPAAWSLFAILFCWQLPHFLAISWKYREEYALAGFVMLSGSRAGGVRSGRQSVFFAIATMLATLSPPMLGLTNSIYPPAAGVLGLLFIGAALRFQRTKSSPHARQLFLASIIYLPLLIGLLVLTKK